jgi:putative MATE family efflux protein
VCLVFTNPLIGFFSLSDAQTYDCAKIYMQITCGLILFSYLNSTLTGLYTAQGDSKTPLEANVIGLVINMVLDPLLILGIGPFPRLEVTGAAIATVTAQILVFLVMVLAIFRRNSSRNILREVQLFRRLENVYYISVFKVGVPTALQGTIYCMISMVLTRLSSPFGSAAVAVQRVGGQIESVTWNAADGFGAALNAFMGQNYGAKKYDRIRKGYNIGFRAIALWALFITAVFILFPRPVASLFFHEENALSIAIDYLVIIGISESFMSVELMTIGALSGLGKTKLCSVISILLTGSRIPLAFAFTHTSLGLNGIWWALTISSVAKGIVFYFSFQKVSHQLER